MLFQDVQDYLTANLATCKGRACVYQYVQSGGHTWQAGVSQLDTWAGSNDAAIPAPHMALPFTSPIAVRQPRPFVPSTAMSLPDISLPPPVRICFVIMINLMLCVCRDDCFIVIIMILISNFLYFTLPVAFAFGKFCFFS